MTSKHYNVQYDQGDLVRLKSGGPKMTVRDSLKDGKILCAWFDRNGKLHSEPFAPALIEAFISRSE